MKIIEKLLFSWHAAKIAWHTFDEPNVWASVNQKLTDPSDDEVTELLSDRIRRLCDEDRKNAERGNHADSQPRQ